MIKRGLAVLLLGAALVPAPASAVVRGLVAYGLDSSTSEASEMESFEGLTCMDALAQIRAERNMTVISSDAAGYRFVLQGGGKTGAIAVLHCGISSGSPD